VNAVAPSRETGERRAALELHRLGRGDRAWVLSRLAPDDRARAARRLAELDALGVRFELGEASVDAAAPASARARVRGADAHAIARALDDAPRWIVDALLEAEPWPWRDDVRAALGARGRVATASRGPDRGRGPSSPAMTAALVELVAARLPAATAAAAGGAVDRHPHPGPGWSRLWSGVKQWLR